MPSSRRLRVWLTHRHAHRSVPPFRTDLWNPDCWRAFQDHREFQRDQMRVVARHRQTTFIAAHMANNSENLEELGRWLDANPNLYVDISARIAELGRQPLTARKFFLKFADRILFGTDGPRTPGRLDPHWRMLETHDEYFPYADDEYPPQGLWNIYGLDLPDDVLRKVYAENAVRIVPGVAERLAHWKNAKAGTAAVRR